MIRLAALEQWRTEESDRLRPVGQDPVDDALEQRAAEAAAADRAFDHTPALDDRCAVCGDPTGVRCCEFAKDAA